MNSINDMEDKILQKMNQPIFTFKENKLSNDL